MTLKVFLWHLQLTLWLAIVAAEAAPAWAIDCKKASTGAETMVCRDAGLRSMDAEMSAEYENVLRTLPAKTQERLMAMQRKWLLDRDSCIARKSARGCMMTAYGERKGILIQAASQEYYSAGDNATTSAADWPKAGIGSITDWDSLQSLIAAIQPGFDLDQSPGAMFGQEPEDRLRLHTDRWKVEDPADPQGAEIVILEAEVPDSAFNERPSLLWQGEFLKGPNGKRHLVSSSWISGYACAWDTLDGFSTVRHASTKSWELVLQNVEACGTLVNVSHVSYLCSVDSHRLSCFPVKTVQAESFDRSPASKPAPE